MAWDSEDPSQPTPMEDNPDPPVIPHRQQNQPEAPAIQRPPDLPVQQDQTEAPNTLHAAVRQNHPEDPVTQEARHPPVQQNQPQASIVRDAPHPPIGLNPHSGVNDSRASSSRPGTRLLMFGLVAIILYLIFCFYSDQLRIQALTQRLRPLQAENLMSMMSYTDVVLDNRAMISSASGIDPIADVMDLRADLTRSMHCAKLSTDYIAEHFFYRVKAVVRAGDGDVCRDGAAVIDTSRRHLRKSIDAFSITISSSDKVAGLLLDVPSHIEAKSKAIGKSRDSMICDKREDVENERKYRARLQDDLSLLARLALNRTSAKENIFSTIKQYTQLETDLQEVQKCCRRSRADGVAGSIEDGGPCSGFDLNLFERRSLDAMQSAIATGGGDSADADSLESYYYSSDPLRLDPFRSVASAIRDWTDARGEGLALGDRWQVLYQWVNLQFLAPSASRLRQGYQSLLAWAARQNLMGWFP